MGGRGREREVRRTRSQRGSGVRHTCALSLSALPSSPAPLSLPHSLSPSLLSPISLQAEPYPCRDFRFSFHHITGNDALFALCAPSPLFLLTPRHAHPSVLLLPPRRPRRVPSIPLCALHHPPPGPPSFLPLINPKRTETLKTNLLTIPIPSQTSGRRSLAPSRSRRARARARATRHIGGRLREEP